MTTHALSTVFHSGVVRREYSASASRKAAHLAAQRYLTPPHSILGCRSGSVHGILCGAVSQMQRVTGAMLGRLA